MGNILDLKGNDLRRLLGIAISRCPISSRLYKYVCDFNILECYMRILIINKIRQVPL